MFKLPQQSKQLKQGQVFNGPWKLWLRGGFCDARPTVVQKVLEGLTKFNSLNKALLDLRRDGKGGHFSEKKDAFSAWT